MNISWGLIDGFASIYGGMTDKADKDKIISELEKDRNNKELRGKLLDSLEDSAIEYLTDEERKVIEDSVGSIKAWKTRMD